MYIPQLIFYFFIFILSCYITKKFLHKFQNLPPTPFPNVPILGHLHLLKNPTSAHRTLLGLSNKYGPVVSLQLGARPTLLVSSPSGAEDCLHQNDVVFANRPRLAIGKILGYDYTTMVWAPYSPLWRNHRRIASTEILSPHRLHLLAHIRANEVKFLVRRIMHASNMNVDRAVEIKPELLKMTNNIVMRMIAGKRCYDDEDEGMRFDLMIKELLDLGGLASSEDFLPFVKYLGFSAEKRFKGICGKLDGFFQDLVEEHRKKMEGEVGDYYDGNNKDCDEKNKSLIRVLLELQKSDPSYFTDNIIKGLVRDLFLAGTETSASTMEWALSLLLNNPQVLHKAQEEIDEHVGLNRLIEESDLSNLPYLHCIINETLRMYPAVPILPPHESSIDCTIGGYHVPRGTMLFINIWAIQNDPKYWDEPRVFNPERFQSVKSDRIGYMFMPFGSGRRACPGKNIAMRVVGLTLGSLIQCFDWDRVDEDLVDMEEIVGVTMFKVKPLQAKCTPRNNMFKFIS